MKQMGTELGQVTQNFKCFYSKPPTDQPSSQKLSKTQTCSHVQSCKLVHVSGIHCHMCASSIQIVLLCTIQYWIQYSSTVCLFQALDVQEQV